MPDDLTETSYDGFDQADRDRWREAAAAAVAAAALKIRKRMAANIGTTLPAPETVFQSEWWDAELDSSIRAEFTRIAAEASESVFTGATGGTIDPEVRDAIAAGVAAGVIGVMGGRGPIVSERVQAVVDQESLSVVEAMERGVAEAEAQERATERLLKALGLQDGGTAETPGVLSDALTADFGEAASTGLVEMASLQTLLQSGFTGEKRWHAVFHNTRESHALADGQTVPLDEVFTLTDPVYGVSYGQAPYDPELPPHEVCGCQCFLTYPVLKPVGDTVGEPPDEELALVASANRMPSVHGVWRGRTRTWAVRNRKGAQRLIANHAAAFALGPDYSDSVCVTVEPTPAEKAMLAVEGGLTSGDLHVTVCHLGKVADFDEAARQGMVAALASVADQVAPFEGAIAGAGYFGTGDDAADIYLVDAHGLTDLRAKIADALANVFVDISATHDAFVPHLTAGYGPMTLPDQTGMPLHFNNVRLRWGSEVLVFDLLGPIAQPPEVVAVESEVAPVPDEVPMPDTTELTIGDLAVTLADAIPMDDDPLPPANLADVADDDLSAEVARRLADAAVVEAGQLGAEVDPAVVAGLHADAEVAVAQALTDVESVLVESASGLDSMDADPDDLPQTPVIPVPAGYGIKYNTTTGEVTRIAAPGTLTLTAASGEILAAYPPVATSTGGTMTHTQVTYAVDLTGATDEEIAAELARRATDRAVDEVTASGYTPTDDERQAAHDAATAEAAEAMIDLVDSAADAIVGDDEDITNDDGGAESVGDVMMPAMSDKATARLNLTNMRLIPRATLTLDLDTPLTDETVFPASGRPFAVEGNPPAPEGIEYEWEGILCAEGVPTDDGRLMAEGSIKWRQLPLPLAFLDKITSQHQEGAHCGTIHAIERRGNAIWGFGTIDDNEAGNKMRAYLSDPKGAGRYGVSVDIGAASVVYASTDGTVMDEMEAEDAYYGGEQVMEMMTEGHILGATLVLHPALAEANVWLCSPLPVIGTEDPPAVAASAGGVVWHTLRSGGLATYGNDVTALVASAGGDLPPAPKKECFDLKPDSSEAFQVFAPDADGLTRVYGLVAKWGDCHIGFEGRCVPVPRSNDFSHFYADGDKKWQKFYGGPALSRFYAGNKCVLTRENEMVQVGPLILNTVHPSLARQASDTQPFYAHTGSAIADVRLYTNEYGIVAAGVIRADADPLAVRALRASDVSPDWRYVQGELKILALLAVPVSGFQIEGIAASAGQFKPWAAVNADGEVMALVAAGAIHRERPAARFTSDDLAMLTATVERQSEQIATLVAQVEALSVPINRDRAAKAMKMLALTPVADGAACGCGSS